MLFPLFLYLLENTIFLYFLYYNKIKTEKFFPFVIKTHLIMKNSDESEISSLSK